MDRKELEEYRRLVVRYLEEHERYKELLFQFSSVVSSKSVNRFRPRSVSLTLLPIRRLETQNRSLISFAKR